MEPAQDERDGNGETEVGLTNHASIPRVLGMHDMRRMALTSEEVRWAAAIKSAIEGTSEVDNLNDFMYAQLALIERGNVESALRRARQLQEFKAEYRPMDSEADGFHHLGELVRIFPEFLLSFSFDSESTGSYVLVHNFRGFSSKALNTSEKLRTYFCGCYYILTCFCPDLESIRSGAFSMAECGGYDWNLHIDTNLSMRFWTELALVYPIRFREMKFFHCGVFINLLYSMTKRLLPQDMSSKFSMGCQAFSRLDEIYLVPTVAAANQRILERMKAALSKRYNNELSFSLPKTTGR